MSKVILCLCFSFGLSELITECPSERWEQHYGTCYWFDPNVPFTWDDAASLCSEKKAVMISPKSDVEKTFLTDFFKRNKLNNLWIGLSDKEDEDNFVWQDGSPLKQSQAAWAPRQPDDSKQGQDCVAVWSKHPEKWDDARCDNQLKVICQVQATLVDPKLLTKCPSEQWKHHRGKCYWFDSNISLPWNNASGMCSQMNAVIISPKTIEENTFMKQFYKRNIIESLFIGLNDKETEGRFVWEDGTPLTESEAAWCPTQPDNHNGIEHCAQPVLDSAFNCWNDTDCNVKRNMICEVQATVVDPKTIVKCSSEQWEQHDGKCYWFDPTNMASWDDGADLCSQMNAVMISPKTDVEKVFLRDFYKRHKLNSLWIGVNDMESEKKFVWQDGTPLQKSEEGWNPYSPDSYTPEEDCAELYSNGWNDEDCSHHKQIICEAKATDGEGSTSEEPCACTCSDNQELRIDYSKIKNKDLLKTLEPKLQELDKILRVNKSKLSNTRNKLRSKSDDRLSAKGMGLVAVTFLVLTVGTIVASDLSNWCKQRKKNIKIANTP